MLPNLPERLNVCITSVSVSPPPPPPPGCVKFALAFCQSDIIMNGQRDGILVLSIRAEGRSLMIERTGEEAAIHQRHSCRNSSHYNDLPPNLLVTPILQGPGYIFYSTCGKQYYCNRQWRPVHFASRPSVTLYSFLPKLIHLRMPSILSKQRNKVLISPPKVRYLS